ncbi:hypothetical protein [Common midwife toad virus]|uniref:Uncharacterized protein n=1 Tax=Common midwife toad virus TaxID=540070 RepID=A0A2D0XMD4_9VIRU|nr:hypothetical protein [Common midwife toad virus]
MLHADRLSRRRRTDDVFPKRGLAMDRHRSKHEDHRRYASDVLLNTGAGVGVYAGPHEHYDYTLGDWLEHFSPSEETVDNCLQQALMATAVMHGEMAMAHSRLRPSAVRLAAPDPRHRNSFRLYRMGDREFHLRCDAPHVMLDGFHDTVVYDAVIDPDHGERGTPVGVAVRTKRGGCGWGGDAGVSDTDVVPASRRDRRMPRMFPVKEFADCTAEVARAFSPLSKTAAKIASDIEAADLSSRDAGWATRPDAVCARYFPELRNPPRGCALAEIVSWAPDC